MLSHISGIYIVKRGHDSVMNKTIHYQLVIQFLNVKITYFRGNRSLVGGVKDLNFISNIL